MKELNKLLFLFVVLTALSSCGREELDYNRKDETKPEVKPEMVELALRQIVNMNVVEVGGTPAASTRAITTDEFIVSLYKEDNTLVESWVYKDMPELISVLSGNYYVKAISHVLQPIDNKAYFEGMSGVFGVSPGAITEVEPVVCEMKSIKTVVTFSSDLIDYLGKDVTVIIKVGNSTYTYSDITTTDIPVYFAPTNGETTVIYVTFEGTVDGFKENFTKTYGAAPGESLSINFNLKNVSDGEITASGSIGLKLAVDLSVIRIDKDFNISGGEEVLPEEPGEGEEGGGEEGDETKPTVKGRGFDIKVAQNVPESGEMSCVVDITASDRIAHLYVTIDSDVLTEDELDGVGLKKQFDLAYPGDLESALGEGLGFPVSGQVIGQKSLEFNITTFIPLLAGLDPGTHKFIIKIVDQANVEVEETLTLITTKSN